MKYLLPILFLFLGGADECQSPDKRDRAARFLGSEAVCTWANNDEYSKEVICIHQGRRYSCIVTSEKIACANTSPASPVEAP